MNIRIPTKIFTELNFDHLPSYCHKHYKINYSGCVKEDLGGGCETGDNSKGRSHWLFSVGTQNVPTAVL